MMRKNWMVALLAVSTVMPTAAMAGDLQPPSRVADVALHAGGVLHGILVDTQRRPLAAQQIHVRFEGNVIATVTTDERGRFAIRGLRGGTYTIDSNTGGRTVQLWAPQTAPPSAQQGALVVAGKPGTTVRGQFDGEQFGPAIRGAIAGGLITGLTYWALDHNEDGS